ncbi:MAG: FxLYD domain-containing protein [Firmicutes bacterium]|nr:FxLYD domain-containing protein [Bacillota bacterium]
MKNRLFTVIALTLLLTAAFAAGVFAANKGVNLIINGQKFEGAGVIQDGKVLVPLETIVNALGGVYELSPGMDTATVNFPMGGDLKDSYTIKVNKITEGISILTVAGEVTNISNSKLTSLTVYGKLLDADGKELTRTFTYSLNPTELAPGQTGTFEMIFLDYYNFKDQNARYGIYVQGFTL